MPFRQTLGIFIGKTEANTPIYIKKRSIERNVIILYYRI